MERYILVMKSGYEQNVEADESLLLKWANVMINRQNVNKVFYFDNGLIVDLSEVSIIKPHKNIHDFPTPTHPSFFKHI